MPTPDPEEAKRAAFDAFSRFLELESEGRAPAPADFVEQQPEHVRAPLTRLLEDLALLRASSGQDAPPPGSSGRVGPFRLLGRLGEGGAGTVWHALDERLDREVALKVLKAYLTMSERQVARFYREARTNAKLVHPNICRVHEVGELDGVHYIVQELVPGGRTLADHIAAEARSPIRGEEDLRASVALARDIALAVAAAHAQGIAHRDIKPSNVLMTAEGRPLLTDFGLARLVDGVEETWTSNRSGTPLYLSPEQASGDSEPDRRSDVFSLGVTLYELLTLQRPFHGSNQGEVLERIRQARPVDPRKLRPDIPKEVGWICLKALSGERDQRYADAGELAADLDRWLTGDPVAAGRPPLLGQLRSWARARPIAATLAASAAIFLPGLLWLWISNLTLRLEAERVSEDLRGALTAAGEAVSYLALENSHERNEQSPAFLEDLAARARSALADQPALLGQQLALAGRFYRDLGFYAEAAGVLAEASEVQSRVEPPWSPTVVGTRLCEHDALYWTGDLAGALALGRELVEVVDRGPETDDRLLARVLDAHLLVVSWEERFDELAAIEERFGDLRELLRAAAEPPPKAGPEDRVLAARARISLGKAEVLALDYDVGLDQLERGVAELEGTLGATHHVTLLARRDLAWGLHMSRDFEQADAVLVPTLADAVRVLGPGHPATGLIQWMSAQNQLTSRRYPEASRSYASARTTLETWLPHESNRLLALRTAHAITKMHEGLLQESLADHEELVELKQRVLGPEHGSTLISRRARAEVLVALGHHVEGAEGFEELLAIFRARRPDPLDKEVIATISFLTLAAEKSLDWSLAANAEALTDELLADPDLQDHPHRPTLVRVTALYRSRQAWLAGDIDLARKRLEEAIAFYNRDLLYPARPADRLSLRLLQVHLEVDSGRPQVAREYWEAIPHELAATPDLAGIRAATEALLLLGEDRPDLAQAVLDDTTWEVRQHSGHLTSTRRLQSDLRDGGLVLPERFVDLLTDE